MRNNNKTGVEKKSSYESDLFEVHRLISII